MKRAYIILILILLAIPSRAQQAGTVRDGMRAVSDYFGVNFAFDSSLPVDAPFPGQDLRKVNLRRSLKVLFEGTGIEWTVNGRYVLLTAAKLDAPLESFAALVDSGVQMDTIRASVITENAAPDRRLDLGRVSTDIERIRGVVSPLGEGDPVKWVQSLPGISSGADGTTAFFVRGGNMGNTLFSLDGVPVYGYSHILGLTTIVPQDIIQDATLSRGGFDGRENNFTAAHLSIKTKLPELGTRTSVALNNFLLGASSEGRFGNGLSYLVSARVSPLAWEYKAVKGLLPETFSPDGFNASVGDVFGKLRWDGKNGDRIEVSALGSLDSYSFSFGQTSNESVGWNNVLGLVRWYKPFGRSEFTLSASVNSYGNSQEQDKLYRGKLQQLSLSSRLLETRLDAGVSTSFGGRFRLDYGVNARYGGFTPGQVSAVVTRYDILLADAYLQAGYKIPEQLELKGFVRYNGFRNFKDGSTSLDPEAGFSARWSLSPHIALEGTFDRLVQYYHTLEGLPVGWSIDLLVPSGAKVAPESSMQGSVGLSFDFDRHDFSVGGFRKSMDNLVYYRYSPALFNGALAAWEEDVDLGKGSSYGVEFLYEYQGDELYAYASYTLSRTTREGFMSICDGSPFHARFDRRHVLNATAQWRGFNVAFTFQSGHWENGAAETYTMLLPGSSFTAEYFSGVNNYQMPNVLRLDIGYRFSFRTGDVMHELNFGVFNVTNHFNPFMLYFDSSSERWNEVALIPILPSFSYRLNF